MNKCIELFNRTFIELNETEYKDILALDNSFPILTIKDKKYADFVNYVNRECAPTISIASAVLSADAVLCKLSSNITANTISLLVTIGLTNYTIIADGGNLYMEFKKDLSKQ